MDIPLFPEFSPFSLEHKPTVSSLFRTFPPETSELTFTNLFMWRRHYRFSISRWNEGLFILAEPDDGEPYFLPPSGFSDPRPAVHECLEYFRRLGTTGSIQRVGKKMVDQYLRDDNELLLRKERDQFDYIYRTEDLITLKGRKYHRKKNHLNQFVKHHRFEYRKLEPQMKKDCLALAEQWCVIKHCEESPPLAGEEAAIREAVQNMEALDFTGGAVVVDGKVEAFSLGEPLNDTTAVVHIEKANADFQGIYAVINQKFLEHEWTRFEYVNREQDLGEEGLRKAKESYFPDHLLEKYSVCFC